MRILLVEDEPKIVRFLERALTAHGYEMISADNGEDGARLATDETVGLVLLDIMMPGQDGHQTLARIRQSRPDLPVMMLTARDDVQNRVSAFELGADQYLTKPFALEELLARVKTLLRRSESHRHTVFTIGELNVDLITRRVRRAGIEIDLSNREFSMLEFFIRRRGEVLSRGQLLAAIWGYDFDPGSNLVDVYVRYLRHKIDMPGSPSQISTVRGGGYRFEVPDQKDSESLNFEPVKESN